MILPRMEQAEQLEALVEEILLYFSTRDVAEVDFVPSKLPPFVIFESSVLGVGYGIIKPLYAHVYGRLLDVYKQLKVLPAGSSTRKELLHSLHKYSMTALVIKGDLVVAYAARKMLLLEEPDRLSKEVSFLQAVFTKHPKSPGGWEHRRWCHRQRTLQRSQPCLSASEMETERELCRLMAEKYPKNYYAWMHRLWLLPQMNLHQLDDEIYFLRDWLRGHVSDHSAVQHMLQLVHHIAGHPAALEPFLSQTVNPLTLPDQQKAFMLSQWKYSAELLVERPGHDSLWSLRKGLFSMLWQQHTLNVNESAVSMRTERLVHVLENDNTALVDVQETGCMVADEVDFVCAQVLAAKSAVNPIWEPKEHILAALKCLLFVLNMVSVSFAVSCCG